MKLSYDGKRFVLKCAFDEREIPRKHGFHWDSLKRVWYTKDLAVAVTLRAYAEGEALRLLANTRLQISPWCLPLPPNPPGLTLAPHQVEALHFALARNRSYLGLDPGLGKTAVAAMLARAVGPGRIVYICPPFLFKNVLNEFERWGAEENIFVIPDSLLQNEDTRDICQIMTRRVATTLVVDEAHRFKNPESKRTQALFGRGVKDGITDMFKRLVFMSGTPMPNRPIELYPVLSKAAPETIDFMSYFQFGKKYCAGYKSWRGWDFSGASNMDELQRRVLAPAGPFMLRLKKSVLNLPPKIESIFVLTAEKSKELEGIEKKLETRYGSTDDLIKHRIASRQGKSAEDLHVATYRRLLGLEKVPPAVEYIKALVADSDEAFLVFAYHRDVIERLHQALGGLLITGDTPVDKRQNVVDRFQRGKDRVLIANYVAGGIGFTMTKATRVIFVESDWVPGVNDQASDRAHRIGQDKTVIVQHLVYPNSLDKTITETILRKRKAIEYV